MVASMVVRLVVEMDMTMVDSKAVLKAVYLVASMVVKWVVV